MANQLQKGRTFNPGDTVNAVDLNNLVDLAISLPPLVTDSTHAVVAATTGDKALVVRGGVLKQADVSSFPSGVTDVTASVDAGAPYFVLTVTAAAGARNINARFAQTHPNWFLAGPAAGAALANLSLRQLVPLDITTSRTLTASTLDLTLSNYWIRQLPGTAVTITLYLNGGIAGQVIDVYLFQGTAPAQTLVNWDTQDTNPGAAVRWKGGVHPVMTHGTVGASDIYHFVCAGNGLYFGTFDQNFLP